MPGPESAKNAKLFVRICRQKDDAPILECGWEFVRTEPESGNVIAERDGKRIICPKKEFDAFNFPGSDTVWEIINNGPDDEDLEAAKKFWSHLDLSGTAAALIRHARKYDPALAGVQTTDDLCKKTKDVENACFRSMDILRLELKRAKSEYDRCSTSTPFLGDQKDNLLAHWRNIEDKYNTNRYQFETVIRAWHRLIDALESLDKAKNSIK